MNPAARRSTWKFVAVWVGMFGFGFATVPLYNSLCVALGLNGKVRMQAATAVPLQVDASRLVTVQFVTTVNGGRPWAFRAEQPRVQVHPGQLYTVQFYAQNTQDHAVVAQAVPNVAPIEAARHLRKTECFCFRSQAFKAGEEKHMPVVFMLDPALPKDVDTVTLSYTFFDVTAVAQKAGAAEPKI